MKKFIYILLVVFFIGYKNTAMAFWLMLPLIFFVAIIPETPFLKYQDYRLLFFLIFPYYGLYFLIIYTLIKYKPKTK